MDNLPLLTIGVTLLAGLFAVLGVHGYSAGKAQRQVLFDRMSQTGQVTIGGRVRRFRGIDRRLRTTSLGKRIERKISATGLDLTPGEYAVYVVAALLGLYFVIGSIFASFFGLLAACIGLWGGNAFLNYQRTKRTEAFINQLPELTRVLANATQAGLALRTAIGMAVEELDDPAREELRRVADRLAVGHTLDDALNELVERLPSRELTVLVSTLILSNRAAWHDRLLAAQPDGDAGGAQGDPARSHHAPVTGEGDSGRGPHPRDGLPADHQRDAGRGPGRHDGRDNGPDRRTGCGGPVRLGLLPHQPAHSRPYLNPTARRIRREDTPWTF